MTEKTDNTSCMSSRGFAECGPQAGGWIGAGLVL